MLSGREYQVLTALCFRTQQGVNEFVVKIMVKFRDVTPSELEAYCPTQEPYDKAGAFVIQGLAAAFVEHKTGSYTGGSGVCYYWNCACFCNNIVRPIKFVITKIKIYE